MNNAKEQQASLTALDDKQVVAWLIQHPEFFIRNADQIGRMHVPHPVRGTISLVEWHMARQRNRVNQLEDKIAMLMAQAKENEGLFYSLLKLQRRLSSATSLQDMLNHLHRWARDIGLAGANIRLFTDRWHIGAPSDFTHLALNRQAFEQLRIQRFGEQQHYLGTLNGSELQLVLPQAKAIGSVAMSLIGSNADLGVVIFSSRDAQHYYQGQGTGLLQELALILPELVERWVERV